MRLFITRAENEINDLRNMKTHYLSPHQIPYGKKNESWKPNSFRRHLPTFFFANLSPFLFRGESISLFGWHERKEGKVRHLFCISVFLFSPLLLHRCQGEKWAGRGIQQLNLPENNVFLYARRKWAWVIFKCFCRQSRHRRIPCQRLFQEPRPPLLKPKRRT